MTKYKKIWVDGPPLSGRLDVVKMAITKSKIPRKLATSHGAPLEWVIKYKIGEKYFPVAVGFSLHRSLDIDETDYEQDIAPKAWEYDDFEIPGIDYQEDEKELVQRAWEWEKIRVPESDLIIFMIDADVDLIEKSVSFMRRMIKLIQKSKNKSIPILFVLNRYRGNECIDIDEARKLFTWNNSRYIIGSTENYESVIKIINEAISMLFQS